VERKGEQKEQWKLEQWRW
jgi:hypothetical protein